MFPSRLHTYHWCPVLPSDNIEQQEKSLTFPELAIDKIPGPVWRSLLANTCQGARSGKKNLFLTSFHPGI